MKLTKYLAVLCCGTLFAACENPIQDDLNVDNPENYTRIYTVNAVDDASKNTLSFPLERDTSLMVERNPQPGMRCDGQISRRPRTGGYLQSEAPEQLPDDA